MSAFTKTLISSLIAKFEDVVSDEIKELHIFDIENALVRLVI